MFRFLSRSTNENIKVWIRRRQRQSLFIIVEKKFPVTLSVKGALRRIFA